MENPEDQFQFFEVGGCVRDALLGIPTKDVDFAVVAPEGRFSTADEAFEALEGSLADQGFEFFKSNNPDNQKYLTLRGKVPNGHVLANRTSVADFVLARLDGPYSDGRRPDWVKPGTLEDDIFRRDFTVNSLCRDVDGNLIDLVGGQDDVKSRTLRFVGNGAERVAEDGLRVLRGFRFMVTKKLTPDAETWEVLTSQMAAEMLMKTDLNRVRDELVPMLFADPIASVDLLGNLPSFTKEAMFRDGLHLSASTAQKPKGR